MKPISEIRYQYVDDQNFLHFDCYFTNDENENGTVLAAMQIDTQAIFYLDGAYVNDPMMVDAIADAKLQYPKRNLKLFQMLDVEGESLGIISVLNYDDYAEVLLQELFEKHYMLVDENGDLTYDGTDEMFKAIIQEMTDAGYVCEHQYLYSISA